MRLAWELLRVDAGAVTDPAELPSQGWVPAVVPGSVAASPAAVEEHGEQGLLDADHAAWWWRGRTTLGAALPDAQLVLDRVTTHADVWVDGRHVLRSDDAFRRHVVGLGDLAAGDHEVGIRIASWDETPVPRKPRPRWRSALVPDSSIRWRRTPVLGRIPTWEGALPPVGVLGEATLRPRPAVELLACRTTLAPDGTGGLDLTLRCAGPEEVSVTLAAASDPEQPILARTGTPEPDPDGSWRLHLAEGLADVAAWWPHTHGRPALHELRVAVGEETVVRRQVGFARVEARGEDGRFGLRVNGVDVFVRGVVWAATDPRGWTSDPVQVGRDLDTLAAAGVDLVRVPGTGTYADEVLREACAERGMLVWQEAMLATFDPPEDDAWLAGLEAELRDQLGAWQGWPHLAVVCGGTETEQQPTLMGVPAERRRMTAIHELLPRLAAELVPGAVHVTSSPSGGPRPVSIAHGVSHYFGVGAYLRPLEDARTAQVSFASEALAFAVPPETSSLGDAPAERGPGSAWRRAAPHDRGTEWDFVDVTDHYVAAVADAERIAEDAPDQEAWEDLQRAAAATATTETFAAWRSSLTPTGGGVVLAHRDLAPGPGWGLLDHDGAPKAPLLALHDVLAPVALLLVDRGLDGILLEAVNDTGEPVHGTLALAAQDRGGSPVLDAELELAVPAHSRARVEVEEALGGFRDLGWAWRFAPEPAYSVLSATWTTPDGPVRAVRRLAPLAPRGTVPVVRAEARADADGTVTVTVTADTPAHGVRAEAPGWVADHGWWSLPAEGSRSVRLHPSRPGAPVPAEVVVRTLDGPPVRVPVEPRPDTD